MAQVQLDHRLINPDHPALSAVPIPPAAELEHRSSDHGQESSSALPPPPSFSPPIYNLIDDNHENSIDMSLSHSTNLTNDLDLTLESSQNNSHGSIEPRTPEPVRPNLSFINFVTGQTPSLSLASLGEPEQKIHTEEDREIQNSFDRSTDLEVEESMVSQDPLAEQVSMYPAEGLTTNSIDHFNINKSKKIKTSDDVGHAPSTSNSPVSETHLPSQTAKSLTQNSSYSAENWLDITKTEFQVAIGLFVVPWSTMIILSRLINQLLILTFSQSIPTPITGLFTSIFAPSLLYSSLITLFITSFDHLS